jgi:16S rRNA processing protein RimM
LEKACSSELLLLGKVLKPHGLEGILRIQSFAESAGSFEKAGRLVLRKPGRPGSAFPVLSARPHKNIVLLRLDGLDSVEKAEEYKDAGVYIHKEDLDQIDEDEYFWYELIGLEVYLDTGSRIGTLTKVLATGANDVYVIQTGETEIMIPAIHDVIEEIDLDGKRMILTNMEGLLDLNEV